MAGVAGCMRNGSPVRGVRARARLPPGAAQLAHPRACPPPTTPRLPKVAIYGMNPRVGLLSFPPEENQLHKPYSDDTARLIDTEVRALVDESYQRTLRVRRGRRRCRGGAWGQWMEAGGQRSPCPVLLPTAPCTVLSRSLPTTRDPPLPCHNLPPRSCWRSGGGWWRPWRRRCWIRKCWG